MVQGHSRPVESGSRKNGGDDVGILGGMPGDSAGSPDLLEAGVEGEVICPVCNGSGESRFGPVGKGWCEMCGGDGLLREIEDYEDFNEWERGMGW